MYKGSCLCGAINVELKGSIDSIIHCHCSLCRKNSGTAYATNGFIKTEDFSVLDPEKAYPLQVQRREVKAFLLCVRLSDF